MSVNDNVVRFRFAASLPMEKLIREYNMLKLAERGLNNFEKKWVLPLILTVTPQLQITAAFAVIRFHGTIELPHFLIYPLAFMCAFVGLMVSETLAGMAATTSAEVISKLKVRAVKKFRKRQIWALSLIKIEVGDNYLDRSTSLVTQNICANSLVSLLLAF